MALPITEPQLLQDLITVLVIPAQVPSEFYGGTSAIKYAAPGGPGMSMDLYGGTNFNYPGGYSYPVGI